MRFGLIFATSTPPEGKTSTVGVRKMDTLLMREPLPARRRCWTQKVRIGGQTVYLAVGEYPDGRPGEIFIDVAKQGTFLRGLTASLARTASIALQCGADIKLIIHSLRGSNYPPDGPVQGSSVVAECNSVTDWIAKELAAHYGVDLPIEAPEDEFSEMIGEGDTFPEDHPQATLEE